MITVALKSQRLPRYGGRWLYFGEDYLDMLDWERRLGASGRVSFSHLITSTFMRLRQPMIEWASRLGEPYGNSLDWWMTRLAARNTMQTPLFLHLCYLHIMLEQLRNAPEDCLVVCDDWFLLRTLELNLSAEGYRVRRAPLWWLALAAGFLTGFSKACARWPRDVARQLGTMIAARVTRGFERSPATRGVKRVLIHTCVDESCLGPDGQFRDRFFSRLSDWLGSQGHVVTTIPWLYNVERSVRSAFRWFRRSNANFLIIYDHVRLWDFPACLVQILRSARIGAGQRHFGNFDVTPLVLRERIWNVSSAENLKFLLYIPALERWFKEGNRCDIYIDSFENMACERPALIAIRRNFPTALTVGYQHAPAPYELIGYSMSACEWATGMFPARIVSHGRASLEFLLSEGFPSDHVIEGPALRYPYLVDSPVGREKPSAASGKSILVVLPLELPAAVELMMALLGCRDILCAPALSIALKVHPMMPRDFLMRRCKVRELPEGWRWAGGGMQEQLLGADVVVGLATGALFEAAAHGLTVICLGRELGFAYNPLEPLSERHEVCGTVTPDRFRARLADVLNEKAPAVRFRLPQLSSDILAGLGRLDQAHFSAFL
jgi:surface carbohydrate biosynthesis protein (TIGR04326 family)